LILVFISFLILNFNQFPQDIQEQASNNQFDEGKEISTAARSLTGTGRVKSLARYKLCRGFLIKKSNPLLKDPELTFG